MTDEFVTSDSLLALRAAHEKRARDDDSRGRTAARIASRLPSAVFDIATAQTYLSRHVSKWEFDTATRSLREACNRLLTLVEALEAENDE